MNWRGLFLAGALFGVLFALAMVVAGVTQSSTYAALIATLLPDGAAPLGVAGYLHASVGGALYAGWALTLWLVARNERLAREPSLWTAILAGLACWYVLDCVGSVAAGAPLNLVGNTVYFLFVAVPVVALRRAGVAPSLDALPLGSTRAARG